MTILAYVIFLSAGMFFISFKVRNLIKFVPLISAKPYANHPISLRIAFFQMPAKVLSLTTRCSYLFIASLVTGCTTPLYTSTKSMATLAVSLLLYRMSGTDHPSAYKYPFANTLLTASWLMNTAPFGP